MGTGGEVGPVPLGKPDPLDEPLALLKDLLRLFIVLMTCVSAVYESRRDEESAIWYQM